MSPTVFREGPYRFFFFSREEPRRHVHVLSPDGEAKFWLEPEVELAVTHGFPARTLTELERIVRDRKEEIINAWNYRFPG
ncbi:MAG: DUF4160 domain-containing protein [Spirochaetaceae bacterium]|nr:MAG: DUF4160 domain-containing protein [Spirochaetaceae bacterium]